VTVYLLCPFTHHNQIITYFVPDHVLYPSFHFPYPILHPFSIFTHFLYSAVFSFVVTSYTHISFCGSSLILGVKLRSFHLYVRSRHTGLFSGVDILDVRHSTSTHTEDDPMLRKFASLDRCHPPITQHVIGDRRMWHVAFDCDIADTSSPSLDTQHVLCDTGLINVILLHSSKNVALLVSKAVAMVIFFQHFFKWS
jgi:hypothetical protein